MRKLACLALMMLMLATAVMARDTTLDAMVHKELEKQVLVIHDSNVADLQKLTPGGKDWLICDIQCSPEQITPQNSKAIMDWVAAGGSLWYQDSRMATAFGMEPDPLRPEDISKSESREGPYNTHQKLKGLAAVAYPVGNAEVLRGVSAIVAFLIPVDKDQYSAVKQGGDVIGLLRATTTAEAMNADKMIAALKKVGTGTVIFKPLVWEESLDSDRFQVNLREWACGYSVPDLSNFHMQP